MSDLASESYDFLLASHVLEHIANPLKALHEWKRVVRSDGILILVIPHRDGTFDHLRPVTALDHIIADFRSNVTEADQTHLNEILALHDLNRDPGAGSQEAFRERANRNVAYRSLHHHVFDTDLVLRLVDHAGLHIEYLDIELPYHVCVACSKTDAGERPGNSGNEAYLAPSAAWRSRSHFPTDRPSSHSRGRS
jgi:SAM-dependent methyltransferase